MAKKLKIWNGRGWSCRNHEDLLWTEAALRNPPAAYVAAYSLADARRLIAEYCGISPSDNEIATYWSEGAWGNNMEGVTPQRGIWIGFEPSSPQRVF